MRELREFREHHSQFVREGVAVAGVSLDSLESHREVAERFGLQFPLLTDPERKAAEAFGLMRSIGIAGWKVEFFRRSTLLADASGIISVVWGRVRIRGHAAEVLNAARVLRAMPEATPAAPSPPSE